MMQRIESGHRLWLFQPRITTRGGIFIVRIRLGGNGNTITIWVNSIIGLNPCLELYNRIVRHREPKLLDRKQSKWRCGVCIGELI